MEDGCSKRFEVGMLEAPAGGFGLGAAKGTEESRSTDIGPMGTPMPPAMTLTMNPSSAMNMDRGLNNWR